MSLQFAKPTRVCAGALLAASLIVSGPVFAQTPGISATRFPWQTPVTAQGAEYARLQKEAQAVTITRDDWGIPHIHGKTDADAVFGMIYAQCEDDFNRVEMNYLTALGWSAQAEGES